MVLGVTTVTYNFLGLSFVCAYSKLYCGDIKLFRFYFFLFVAHKWSILDVTCSYMYVLGTNILKISVIRSKALSRINNTHKLKFKLVRKSLQLIYFSFIRPLLD